MYGLLVLLWHLTSFVTVSILMSKFFTYHHESELAHLVILLTMPLVFIINRFLIKTLRVCSKFNHFGGYDGKCGYCGQYVGMGRTKYTVEKENKKALVELIKEAFSKRRGEK